MISLLVLAACGRPSTVVNGATRPWPTDPTALLATCEQEPVPEIGVVCRVQAAEAFGRADDAAGVSAACAGIEAPTWVSECHFLAADAASEANHLDLALDQCVLSAPYTTDCVRHIGWLLPPLHQTTDAHEPEQLPGIEQDLRKRIGAAITDPRQREFATEELLAWAGKTWYLGSGSAPPEAAHERGPLGPALRTGFAMETARLLRVKHKRPPAVSDILDRWTGRVPPAQGPTEDRPTGCFSLLMGAPALDARRSTTTWGNASRPVAPRVQDDATIAALHAVLWAGDATSQDFIPWLQDPSEDVALSAIALARAVEDTTTTQCLTRGQTGPPDP